MTHESPLLTPAEAACWLRIVETDAQPSEVRKAVRAVLRLVREDGLRPVQIGRAYAFDLDELRRWIREQRDTFVPVASRSEREAHGDDCGDDDAGRGDES